MGSTMAWWVAALDPRIAVCVDLCCLTDFDALVESRGLEEHGLYYYVPGLRTRFSTAEINALIAPRPHLSLAGIYDRLTPPAGLDRIDAALREVYAAAGAPSAWRLSRYATGHVETVAMRAEVVEFLQGTAVVPRRKGELVGRHPWVAEADGGLRWAVQLIVPEEPGALRAFVEIGVEIERLGFDACLVFDHPAFHVDPWIALTALAMRTERIRLGSAVNCVRYRHPAHLARLAADLDNLSDGRVVLGVGAGNDEPEFAAFGMAFPPARERLAAMEEAVRIVHGAWGEKPFSFGGAHFTTEAIRIQPPPLQRPRPPIMIGGGGTQVTLQQVARFADACNLREDQLPREPSVTDSERAADVRRKFDALARHCAELGRPENEILRTHMTLYLMLAPTEAEAAAKLARLDPERSTHPRTRRAGNQFVLAATPERAISYYRALAAAGVQYFVVQLDASDRETIDLLAREVVPALG